MKFKLAPEKISTDKEAMKEIVKKMFFAFDRRCSEEGYQRPPSRREHIRYKSADRKTYLRQRAASRSNRKTPTV